MFYSFDWLSLISEINTEASFARKNNHSTIFIVSSPSVIIFRQNGYDVFNSHIMFYSFDFCWNWLWYCISFTELKCVQKKYSFALYFYHSNTHSLLLCKCFFFVPTIQAFQLFTLSLVIHLGKTPYIFIDKPTTYQSFCACLPSLALGNVWSADWLITRPPHWF